MNKIPGRSLIALCAVLLLNGCPTQPVQEPESEPVAVVPEVVGVPRVPVEPTPRGYTAADLRDPASPLYQRVVYFEYDSSAIRPQFIDVLRAHGSYLASNPTAGVTLDGHTDERGTREYNLALGDHRAETVRRFLLAEGVADGQIATMSYGEERPADPGHSESAWELNRRVELVY